LEKELMLSRRCLQILRDRGLSVQVVTKSDLVTRDLDILEGMEATVAISVTTLRPSLSMILEPGAPLPKSRLDAINRLRRSGVPVSARIDPVIPGLNDSEIEDLVTAVCGAGAEHITSSTYKARPDNLLRICTAFPEIGAALKALFRKGSRSGSAMYLPQEVRRSLMQEVQKTAMQQGVTFSTCREGSAAKNGVSCDGSHLLAGKVRCSVAANAGQVAIMTQQKDH
jgi:DNA repair photolyase